MKTARDEILGRIRSALADVPKTERPEEAAVGRTYMREEGASRAVLVERFMERVAEYKAHVQRVAGGDLLDAIASILASRGAGRVIIPRDFPAQWRPRGVSLVADDGLSYEQVEAADGVLTACALGIAQTGTIVLDAGACQGRRAITLLPDYHLCVIRDEQIVANVPEAVARLRGVADRPLTWISGPSATSDIELSRVEGVHGPRTLEVLIINS